MEPTIIYLEDRRLKLFNKYEAVQQGAAAVVLISAGYGRLTSPSGRSHVLSVGLIVAGALLFVASVRELRGQRMRHPGLLNLAAGVALLTEWGVSIADGGRTFRASLVMGVVSLGLWLFHTPLERGRRNRRTLRLDGNGVSFWLNPVRRFRVRWADLSFVSVEPTAIHLQRSSGRRHRIPLARLENAGDVSAAVTTACRAAGVECRVAGATTTS